jgi:RNA polymerase sigma-70 factor (sigma-E family)
MADHAEFDAFVVACSPRLVRTAYLLVRDRQLAEDLLQTALTKAWFAWGRIEGNPEPYVRRVMVTTAVSWWRRRWTGEVPSERLPERPDAPAEGPDQDVWQALGRLPARQRAVVVLRFYEDLSEVDTADLLGCSVGTVKSQCARALAKLRVDDALQPDQEQTDQRKAMP